MVVDGESRRLPDTSGSYVVAVPAGAAAADLVMKADGVKQSLSLLTGQPGPDNLAVLARRDRSRKIGEGFPLTETSTIPLAYGDGVSAPVRARRDGGLGQAGLLRRRPGARLGLSGFLVVEGRSPGRTATRRATSSSPRNEVQGDDGKDYKVVDSRTTGRRRATGSSRSRRA